MNCKYKVIDKKSPWFGQVLEYASCSSLEDWTAVILFVEPSSEEIRNSSVFRKNQVEKIRSLCPK